MKIAETIEQAFTSYLEKLGIAWWIEIVTAEPTCTYYFGPFMSAKEAESYKGGYLEDLESEGAQGFAVYIHRCQPTELTIANDLEFD
jgi:hypothetical protein